MSVDTAQFLKDFPAFNTVGQTDPDQVQISPASITFWLNVADKMLSQDRWGSMRDLAQEMFAAHNVILEVLAQRDMDVGGVPGVATGMVAGKSSGDVQIAYNNAAVLEIGAGHWNYTIYGMRLYRMMMMFGAGPIQLGAGGGCSPLIGAWQGPWVYNVPNPS